MSGLQRCCFSKTRKALRAPEVPDMSARTSSLAGPANLVVSESMFSRQNVKSHAEASESSSSLDS